ncbi:MAG: type I-U CRISPR-associated protein Cas7 [Bryobacterales bacterium]|nr:type I-U CRISPR-associated protein Cas7 [Bryobacterales bacterium]
MSLDLSPLDGAARLLVEAELTVESGGGRFQSTGFPDLGPALFRGADGADWLLVESPQSMANRLELACWDEAAERFDPVCDGIPFIRSEVTVGGEKSVTSTVQESHRLASPYILDGVLEGKNRVWEILKASSEHPKGLGLLENRPFLLRNHASRLLRLDPGSLLHGVWLSTKVEGSGRQKKALCGGKVRFPRMLSAYIEAQSPQLVNSGGVKRERILDQAEAGTTDAESGFGSIPYPRTEFTSANLRAFFSLDLQLLRTLALGEREDKRENEVTKRVPRVQALKQGQGDFTNEEAFLIVWALYKIDRFLSHGLTLRSNCRLTCRAAHARSPAGFSWQTDLEAALKTLRGQLFSISETEEDAWKKRNVLTVAWSGTASADDTAGATEGHSNADGTTNQ